MRFTFGGALFALAASQVVVAAQWGFTDGTVAVSSKGAGVGGGAKQKLVMDKKLPEVVKLSQADSLKILLTTAEGKTAKKAHQAFLSLADDSGLETSFALSLKENGKGKLDLTQRDIPPQLLKSDKPLHASLVIASFGSTKPYKSAVFDISVYQADGAAPVPAPTASVPPRFGKLPEIHHIFRGDPRSPPKVVTLVFTAAVFAALPVVLGAWIFLGGNFDHLGKALGASPVGHALYFGGIVTMQAIFAAYYWSWNLFQVIPAATVVGVVILFAGSRALTEVQERRLKAER